MTLFMSRQSEVCPTYLDIYFKLYELLACKKKHWNPRDISDRVTFEYLIKMVDL